jgi:hypothetical protein
MAALSIRTGVPPPEEMVTCLMVFLLLEGCAQLLRVGGDDRMRAEAGVAASCDVAGAFPSDFPPDVKAGELPAKGAQIVGLIRRQREGCARSVGRVAAVGWHCMILSLVTVRSLEVDSV